MITIPLGWRLVCVAVVGWLLGPALMGQPSVGLPPVPPPWAGQAVSVSAADRAWAELGQARRAAPAKLSGGREKTDRALGIADHAKHFYSTYPDHPEAGEGRRYEILALIDAQEAGAGNATQRLAKAVAELRGNGKILTRIRAHGVAAYEFSRAVRSAKKPADWSHAIEKVARALIREFPNEAPGYEALWALARASESAVAAKLAGELLEAGAPSEIKAAAQTLLDRLALVGQPLAAVLGKAGEGLIDASAAGRPVIVYSWATWGPGSLDLGRMIQARRFDAIGICLDEDLKGARATQRKANLGGWHAFDTQGPRAELAARLKFSTAGQIYLVDAAGFIRDVRGADGLETKLAAFGFQTPALIKP